MPHVKSICLVIALLSGLRSFSQAVTDSMLIIHFQTASFIPDSGEIKKLDSFFLKNPGAKLVSVAGHTDTVGKAAYNLTLSRKRSQSLAELLKKYFPGQQYPIQYYGETQPLHLGDNAFDRRVEIRVNLPVPVIVQNDHPVKSHLIKKINLDNLYFEPDKAILESFSFEYLKTIVPVLKSYAGARFEIRGHVNYQSVLDPDTTEYMAIMNKLSVDRAKLIYDILVDNGIPASRMSYKGMGNTQMVYPHPVDDDEKRKNMRVEILVFRQDQ